MASNVSCFNWLSFSVLLVEKETKAGRLPPSKIQPGGQDKLKKWILSNNCRINSKTAIFTNILITVRKLNISILYLHILTKNTNFNS